MKLRPSITPHGRLSILMAILAIGGGTFAGCDVKSGGGDTGGLGGGGMPALDDDDETTPQDDEDDDETTPSPEAGGAGGANGGDESEDDSEEEEKPEEKDQGPATRGFAVVNSDADSASVSLLGLDGQVLSESFISSASADPGLSAALSGDIVFPSTVMSGDELVLIDRYPAGVLTWVNLQSAEVRAQLSVATGFASNPHDYVPYTDQKAYVVRFGGNENPNQEDFDSGNDVLIIDPSTPEIIGQIDLTPALDGESEALLPRGERSVIAAGKLRVLSAAISADFATVGSSRIVSIDPQSDSISDVTLIEGFRNCGNLSVSPNGKNLAVACSGAYGQDPSAGFPDAGIVIFELGDEPKEISRIPASALGSEQIGNVEYANENTLAYTTTGRYNDDFSAMAAPDTARLLTLDDKDASEPLVETQVLPYNLGDFRCESNKGICFLADAETDGGVVHHFRIDGDGRIEAHELIVTDTQLGLPPRYLGKF